MMKKIARSLRGIGFRWFATLAMLLGLGLLSGCQTPLDTAGQSLLSQAYRNFEYGQYDTVIDLTGEFLTDYPRAAERSEALYLRGLSYRRSEPANDEAALVDLRRSANLCTQNSAARSMAELAIGHIMFERNTASSQLEAINYYQQALPNLPDTAPKDALLYRLAVASQNLGQWSQADRYLSQCMNEFPESGFAEASRIRFGARQFRVQLAAYSNLARATAHIDELSQSGITADWTPIQRGSNVLYAVRYGRYSNYAEAMDGLSSIRYVQPDAAIVAVEPNQFRQP